MAGFLWPLIVCLWASASTSAAAAAAAVVNVESHSSIARDNSDLSPQFVVGIADADANTNANAPSTATTTAAAAAVAGDVRVVTMTAHNGRKFECSIPNTEPVAPHKLAAALTAANAKATSPIADSATSPAPPPPPPSPPSDPYDGIAIAIRNGLGNGCFTKSEGYWTYEVCPFKSVRQYHRDGQNGPIGISFSLGRHDPTQDAVRTVAAPFKQVFVGGTDSRQTQVNFRCNPDPAPGDGVHRLTSVTEPNPFKYVAEIITPLACPRTEPSGTADASSAGAGTPAGSVIAGTRSSNPSAAVIELLDGLSQNCLYLNTGWWLYRFCHLRGVSQLHREHRPVKGHDAAAAAAAAAAEQKSGGADKSGGIQAGPPMELVTVAEFDLGHIDAGTTMAQLEQMTTIVASDKPEESYVKQVYAGGTACDVGDRRTRRTEIRLYCNAADQSAGAVESITETTSCEYVLKVKTKLLCSHPAFAARQQPVFEIKCVPVSAPTSLRR